MNNKRIDRCFGVCYHNVMKEKIKGFLPIFIGVAGCAAFYLTLGCPIRYFTGVCCPSCGMSRAAWALLHFDFAAAFHFHPLIWLPPAAVLVYLFRRHIPKKALTALGISALGLMLTVYLVRMLSGSEIVYFNPQNGAVARLFKYIFNLQ